MANKLNYKIISLAGLCFYVVVLLMIIFGYQLPTLELQHKKITCLNHGFFDYIEETDECRTLHSITKKPYEEVKEHKHWGVHCEILDDCIKLREKVNSKTS